MNEDLRGRFGIGRQTEEKFSNDIATGLSVADRSIRTDEEQEERQRIARGKTMDELCVQTTTDGGEMHWFVDVSNEQSLFRGHVLLFE